MSDRDIDGLVKRLDDEIAAIMGPVGNPAEEPVVLYMDAAAAIMELQAERDRLFRTAALAEEWRDHDKTRAETAEAERDRLRDALERIAKQKTVAEIAATEDIGLSDFEDGYDGFIEHARAALATPPKSGT